MLTLTRGVALGAALAAAPAMALSEQEIALLAAGCANCHGPDGRSPGAMPSIAGSPLPVLSANLTAFKAGQKPGTTVMTRLAKGFSDEELEALARHFSSLPQ